MKTIRVSKEFNFEMAHALYGHDGPCRNIHGHSYILTVCVIGKVFQQKDHSKDGMVIDFSDLKKIVQSQIINVYDHALVLNANAPDKIDLVKNGFEKTIYVSFQPTCENLLIEFENKISSLLPKNIQLHHLRLNETATSFAEWYTEDNIL